MSFRQLGVRSEAVDQQPDAETGETRKPSGSTNRFIREQQPRKENVSERAVNTRASALFPEFPLFPRKAVSRASQVKENARAQYRFRLEIPAQNP